jgi:hypothetical protein
MKLEQAIEIHAYGTSEGVTKSWDVRGRGKADRDHRNHLLAGVLAISNSGTPLSGPMRDRDAVQHIERMANSPKPPYSTGGENAVQIGSHLIESDHMEKAFRDEGNHWQKTLNKMKDDDIKKSWPDHWAMVTGEK